MHSTLYSVIFFRVTKTDGQLRIGLAVGNPLFDLFIRGFQALVTCGMYVCVFVRTCEKITCINCNQYTCEEYPRERDTPH